MAGDSESKGSAVACLGFLTVVECPRDGLFGGYLVVNLLGRPLEFRCTAPIKPNRAQQILYGPTLDPYLYGEQIGQTLLKGSEYDPRVIFTDVAAVLAAGEFVDPPLALVAVRSAEAELPGQNPTEEGDVVSDAEAKSWRTHPGHAPGCELTHFHFGRNRLATTARAALDEATITERLAGLPDSFDLAEPFVRIRSAIEEARRAGGCS